MKNLTLAITLLLSSNAFAIEWESDSFESPYHHRAYQAPPAGNWDANPNNWANSPRNFGGGNPKIYGSDGSFQGYIVPGYDDDEEYLFDE